MKKIYALFVMGLLLLSIVPLAFAEKGAKKSKESFEEANLNKEKLTEGLAKFDKNLEFKARAIDRIKLENARNNFLKAKINFEEARERYNAAKLKFEASKLKLKECKNSDSEECQNAKQEIIQHAKDNLISSADRILQNLEQIKNKVMANEDLSEEEADEIIGNINAQIAEVEEIKQQAQDAETKEEIIAAAKELAKKWNGMKIATKRYLGMHTNAKIGGIIVRSEQLVDKLETKLKKLEEEGKDISEVQGLIDQFNEKIQEAKTSYEAAYNKFQEAKSGDEINTDLIREAQDLLKQARDSLKESHTLLKQIVKSFKEVSQGKDIEEESSEEEQENESEESDE